MLKEILNYLRKLKAFRTSEGAINWYRKKGIKIGEGTRMRNPHSITIDVSRPELITIGRNVLLHKGLTLMTHDYASRVFMNLYSDFIPSHGHITIGNNVWFGQNCAVLKGVTIGDNCIIGYGSVVLRDIPSNSVAAGTPAKVICTLEQYYKKRIIEYESEAIEYCKAIIRAGREPQVEDFLDDYPIFVDGSNYTEYNYPYNRVFNNHSFENWKVNHKARFSSFDEFVLYCKEN